MHYFATVIGVLAGIEAAMIWQPQVLLVGIVAGYVIRDQRTPLCGAQQSTDPRQSVLGSFR